MLQRERGWERRIAGEVCLLEEMGWSRPRAGLDGIWISGELWGACRKKELFQARGITWLVKAEESQGELVMSELVFPRGNIFLLSEWGYAVSTRTTQ